MSSVLKLTMSKSHHAPCALAVGHLTQRRKGAKAQRVFESSNLRKAVPGEAEVTSANSPSQDAATTLSSELIIVLCPGLAELIS